jgi:hypothetical protein
LFWFKKQFVSFSGAVTKAEREAVKWKGVPAETVKSLMAVVRKGTGGWLASDIMGYIHMGLAGLRVLAVHGWQKLRLGFQVHV